jgi:hypothetical protein
MNEIIDGAWLACLDREKEGEDKEEMGERGREEQGEGGREFYADVILCNPPVPIHVHLAERLHVPLQIWFPMPWSQVSAFVIRFVRLSFIIFFMSLFSMGFLTYLSFSLTITLKL